MNFVDNVYGDYALLHSYEDIFTYNFCLSEIVLDRHCIFFFFFLPSVSRHLVIKFERQFRSGKKRGTRAPHISSLLAVVKTDYAIERGAEEEEEEEEDRNARNARVVDEVGTSRGMDRNGYPTHGTVLSFRARDLFPRWLFTRSNPPTAGFVGTVDKSVHPREKVNGCRLHPEGR